jgi:uroporphyrinogen-III synthase
MASANFNGLRVLALESRHAKEISRLITSYGGQPVVAPALREVRLESNFRALEFAASLMDQQFDMVIFLTGAGIRALISSIESVYPGEQLIAAFHRVQIVARGPKPASALGEIGAKPDLVAPAPNTWREILRLLDDAVGPDRLRGMRIAVQ